MNLIKFKPITFERVWGGKMLQTKLGRKLDNSKIIGESWDIVDRDNAQSEVLNEEFNGISLGELIKKHPIKIMGFKWRKNKRFPIIVKLLDCRQRLSLQVHPDEISAAKLGSAPKTEAWFFIDCSDHSKYIAGLKEDVDKNRLLTDIENSKTEDCLQFYNSHKNDFILIKAGCIHAIGADNLILEIQQNSDTTYRVYDWLRPDINGKMRQLHLKESLESINFNVPPPKPISDSTQKLTTLCDCKHFKISKINLKKGESFTVKRFQMPRIISVVDGKISSKYGYIDTYESALLPFWQKFVFIAQTDSSFLITENFA